MQKSLNFIQKITHCITGLLISFLSFIFSIKISAPSIVWGGAISLLIITGIAICLLKKKPAAIMKKYISIGLIAGNGIIIICSIFVWKLIEIVLK